MPDIAANGLTLHYASSGDDADPPILLVMGLGMQLIMWPDALVELLRTSGFRVIRFDNRDAGLSTHLSQLGTPRIVRQYLKFVLRLPLRAPYRIDDMSADTVALIEALGLSRVHIVGASMGGMIAQNVAAHCPERIATLTSIMSTTGRRNLPQPSWKVRAALLSAPGRTFDEAVARMMRVLRVIGSRTYPADETWLRNLCEQHVRRSYDPAGSARQLLAIAATGDRTPLIGRIRTPTLVVHGTEDPLVLPAAGHDTARVIRDAGGDVRLAMIDGMGHDLPLPLLSTLAAEIASHCRRAVA